MTLLAEEGLLDRFQAKDLADFGQKRAYNLIETALKDRVREMQEALGEDGKQVVAQFSFARKAVELAYRLAGAQLDASSFDATPLAALAVHPLPMAANRGVSLSVICGEIDGRLETTRALDAKVRGWGIKNLSALVAGKDPSDVPPEHMGGGLGVLGAIVGRGPASRRASAVTQFKLLGDEFRERLYLLAANAILLRRASGVSQAEEAWRKHLAAEGGLWDAIRKGSADLLGFFLGPLPTSARASTMRSPRSRRSRARRRRPGSSRSTSSRPTSGTRLRAPTS
jgi:hypothetical protein